MTQRIEPGSQDRRISSSADGSGKLGDGGPARAGRGAGEGAARTLLAGAGEPAGHEHAESESAGRTAQVASGREASETTARVIARALDSTIDAPPTNGATPPTSSERLTRICARLPSVARDSYTVGNQVARGGIGRVLRARDQRLDRPVAIKELLVWNDAQERRFIREALLTARLQHPAIVPVYEAGRWPDGEPFYAMKLVSGRTLSELINERRTLAERLSLLPHVLTVAQAIAYAHSQRILHRDLKPANVLVGEFGETVVIDWGLAKGLGEEEDAGGPCNGSTTTAGTPGNPANTSRSNEGLTIAGAIIGTPAYMPPEQALGSPVDERADIYAIGAILYHLIASEPPYHDVPWEKLLATIATEPPRPIDEHAPAISDELTAIVNKAMARDPAARYGSAKELADDLHRFQTGQIVAAHTYSSAQLLRRFWRRNRAVVSIAASALALVTLVVIGAFIKTDVERRFALVQQREAQEAERVAETERKAAEAAGQQATARADEMTLLQARGALARDPNEALAWLKTLSPSYADAIEIRTIAGDARARGISRAFHGHEAHINQITRIDEGDLFATASDDKTIRIWDLASGTSRVLYGHTDEGWRVASLKDGKRIVSTSKDATARIWDIATGAELARVKLPVAAEQVVVRPDGSILGASWNGGSPWLWMPGAAEVRLLVDPAVDVQLAGIAQNGNRVVVRPKDGEVFILDVDTGKRRPLPGTSHERGLWLMNGDGSAVLHSNEAADDKEKKVDLWDVDAAASPRTVSTGASGWPSFSCLGGLIAIPGPERVDVISAKTGKLVRRVPVGASGLKELTFSDDDRLLAVGGYDRAVRIWDIKTGNSQTHQGLKGYVSALVFLKDDVSLLAASTLGDIRLFEPTSDGAIVTDNGSKSWGFVVSADGLVASVGDNGRLRINDLSGRLIAEHELGPQRYMLLTLSPEKQRFAGASRALELDFQKLKPSPAARGAVVFGSFDGSKPTTVTTSSPVRSVKWEPEGGAVLAGLIDGSVQRITPDGSITEVSRLASPVRSIAFSSDGAYAVLGGRDGLVRLLDRRASTSRDLGRHASGVDSLAFSKSGKLLATGSFDHTARIWRLQDGSFRSIDASGGGVLQVAFSPDESTLVTLSKGETFLRRWAVDTGAPLASLAGHESQIGDFWFSPDGRRILTSARDRSARIFDVATGKSRALVDPAAPVRAAAFAKDGAVVLTLNDDGVVRAWPDDLPESMPELRAWIDAATPDRIEGR